MLNSLPLIRAKSGSRRCLYVATEVCFKCFLIPQRKNIIAKTVDKNAKFLFGQRDLFEVKIILLNQPHIDMRVGNKIFIRSDLLLGRLQYGTAHGSERQLRRIWLR